MKMKVCTGGGKGETPVTMTLWLVQKVAEGESSYELTS